MKEILQNECVKECHVKTSDGIWNVNHIAIRTICTHGDNLYMIIRLAWCTGFAAALLSILFLAFAQFTRQDITVGFDMPFFAAIEAVLHMWCMQHWSGGAG